MKTRLVMHEVGQPWPHSIRPQEGLEIKATPAEDHLSLLLLAGLDRPPAREIKALSKKPIRFGILSRPPMTFVVMIAEGLELDAPFAIGAYPPADRLEYLTAARAAHSWGDQTRNALALTIVDLSTRKVAALRTLSLSRLWWRTLSDSLEHGVDASGPVYERAIQGTYAAFPAVKDMIRACAIVETGGAV